MNNKEKNCYVHIYTLFWQSHIYINLAISVFLDYCNGEQTGIPVSLRIVPLGRALSKILSTWSGTQVTGKGARYSALIAFS